MKEEKKKVNQKKQIKQPGRLATFGIGKEKDYFIENVSMLVSAGMSILAALKAVRVEAKSPQMRRILDYIFYEVENGAALWQTLDKTKIFSDHTISLVRIGEESGKLAENLKIISLQEEKERLFRSKIRSAMMYPVLVLSLTVVVGAGIAWFILPKLTTVFKSLKMDLPAITKALIYFGNFLEKSGSVAIPIFLLIFGLVLYLLFFFKPTRFIGQAIIFRLPGIKRIIQQIEISRLGFMLGTLLEAGISITTALNSLQRATTFPIYKKFYAYLQKNIDEGNSFQKSFADNKYSQKLVPPSVQQMIISGEQSGSLASILLKIGKSFESKIETTTKNLSVLLEPVLLVIVWLGVVAVALAVILPIYSLIGGLNEPRNATSPPTTVIEESEKKPNIINQTIAPIMSFFTGKDEEILIESEDQILLPKVKIITNILTVRSAPSLNGDVMSRVRLDEVYEYTDEQNNWYEITTEEEITGWVFGQYVLVGSE